MILVLLLGALLRLVWVEDMEYKGDETWTFERTQQTTEPLPLLGMPTSVEIRNPGMSLWIFQLMARIFNANDPTALARSVQLLGIGAIVALVLFARWCVGPGERELWLWAAALLSVNPLVVLFERKIWPPSVLPIFAVAFLAGWWYRKRWGGALFWGLVGACMGQIHLAAYFFALGFAAWALCLDRRQVAWKWWALGSVLGAVPLWPWVRYLATELPAHSPSKFVFKHVLELKFWTRWILEPLGVGLQHPLRLDFPDFLRFPLVEGRPTYLVALLHFLVIGVGLWVLARAALYLSWARGRWRRFLSGKDSASAFTLNAALWGCGLCMTLSLLPIHRHYMIVAYPLEMLWLARLALVQPRLDVGRKLLGFLCAAQLLLSVSFLSYIHINEGARRGDYGIAYASQVRAATVGRK
jgi:4-amino-4-deoxy-L-arabinose transferase-like glycosyltransferase